MSSEFQLFMKFLTERNKRRSWRSSGSTETAGITPPQKHANSDGRERLKRQRDAKQAHPSVRAKMYLLKKSQPTTSAVLRSRHTPHTPSPVCLAQALCQSRRRSSPFEAVLLASPAVRILERESWRERNLNRPKKQKRSYITVCLSV